MKRVYPIIVPHPTLSSLKQVALKMQNLDLSTTRKDLPEALIVLHKFSVMDEKMEESAALSVSQTEAKHLSFTFLILASYHEADVLTNTSDLRTSRAPGQGGYAIVATGTLVEWGFFLRDNMMKVLPEIKDELRSYFNNLGFVTVL